MKKSVRGHGAIGPRQYRVLVIGGPTRERAAIVTALQADPEIQVVGWASTSKDAVDATVRLRPDVVVMDRELPGMDSLPVARRIRARAATPIVLVTQSFESHGRRLAVDAFDAGVLAIVPTPGAPRRDSSARDLVRTVKAMASVKLAPSGPPKALKQSTVPPRGDDRLPACDPQVVAIGASTGGPQALHDILTRLPGTFRLPVLVVQHMAAGFVEAMVDWLKPVCTLPLEVTATDLPMHRPGIYFAPTGKHLVVRGRKLVLTLDAPVSGQCPSATLLFRSVAQEYGRQAVGVLLSGMGEDGAVGLRDMKEAGALTIAQDEASSAVFGMPAVAIGLGIVDYVLPPAAIAQLLVRLDQRARAG